ncbi:2882_t:CDS:10 [Ambispora leptoticha]|uniref:2882_t:CDS:1 n=1 Tax=Ambispora leptoticha TaxID=144679 RepID=A0A9N8YU39_9GLOM|nr:2882_t:CDS:10 [Ambispora leptoticha]
MDQNLRKDPRYKKYVSSVEKILLLFDKEVNEWADFITFLGKLLKTFQANAKQFNEIPYKLLVGKRLAQSLNRALPHGVHQKALEVYDCIFQSIGVSSLNIIVYKGLLRYLQEVPDVLAEDLSIYSQGLFPLLQYAKLSVKPQLLEIYEKHYFPLQKRLRPVMKAFITALLPGLDEENSEFFDKVLSLLDYLSGIVEQSYFLQCMWLVLITSPSLRTSALNYLKRRMPKITSKEDMAFMLGDDASLMVRAFCATLGDKETLVQRNLLILLVANFPLKDKNVGDIMKQEDLNLLMKSAVSVVLRKDMSLNRWLYAWLLGSDESSEHQIQHFREYGKAGLVTALKGMFFTNARDLTSTQRPYKILISLMDKWEIGNPVVQEILVDILISLKDHMQKSAFAKDLLQTAQMFLQMIPPYVLWMKLHHLVKEQFPSSDSQATKALDLIYFVAQEIKLHEEEIQQIHLPLFLTILLHKLQVLANSPEFTQHFSQIEIALLLAQNLIKEIPQAVFNQPESILNLSEEDKRSGTLEDESGFEFTAGMDPVKYIDAYYNDEIANFRGISGFALVEALLKPLLDFINCLISRCIIGKDQQRDNVTLDNMTLILDRSCGLLRTISKHFTISLEQSSQNFIETRDSLIQKIFDGEWIHSLLKCCYRVDNFCIIDPALSTIIDLIDRKIISSSLLDPKQQTRVIVDKLWSFLNPNNALYHTRCVQLLWNLQKISSAKYVETVFCEYLTHKDIAVRLSSYEKFGIFWRLSDDSFNVSMAFSQPMFLMLDTLRFENPTNRRAGETWMRSQQDSYPKLLDPMITIICNPSIIFRSTEIIIDKEKFALFLYERPFNQAQVNYVFETMVTVCRVSGQGFLRALRESYVKNQLLTNCGWLWGSVSSSANITYTEFFVRLALRYIETEMPEMLSSMSVLNEHIHMHATDLLNLILTRPEFVDSNLVSMIYDVVLRKILYSIRTKKLDLQARLLHLLFSTVIIIGSSKITNGRSSSPSPSIFTKKTLLSEPAFADSTTSLSQHSLHEGSLSKDEKESFRVSTATISSPLYIKVLLQALSVPSNRPLLQQWMDFIINTFPYFRQSFNTILLPLLQCICEQLRLWKSEIQKQHEIVFADCTDNKNASSIDTNEFTASDWNVNTLFSGLEKTLVFCLLDGISNGLVDESDISVNEPTASAGTVSTFVFDYVNSDPEQKPREFIVYQVFPYVVSILLDIWVLFRKTPYSELIPNETITKNTIDKITDNTNANHPFKLSLLQMSEKINLRIIKIFERLCKNNRGELIEAFVELWCQEYLNSIENKFNNTGDESYIIQLLKLIPSYQPQKVISILLESSRVRSSAVQSASRSKKSITKQNKLSDVLILKFLEVYTDSLSSNIEEPLVDVWQQCLGYVKDMSAQATIYKYLLPSLLRFMTVILLKLSKTDFFKETRTQREMQDIYQRVLEYCIQIAGRSFDQFLWSRRVTREDEDTAISIYVADGNDEKDTESPRSSTPLQDEKKGSGKSKEELTIEQVNLYLATSVIPNLRRFFLYESDRVVQILSNVMYYIIAPALKKQYGNAINSIILDMLCEISQIPSVYPRWRKEVWDVFTDNRFFNMSSAYAKKWHEIMKIIMISEKERFTEILARISTSPTNTLFTNRDQESYNRALNLRRLSFILYCGKMDQYLSQLPLVQEKLVELLKLGLTEMVHVEIYLCLRILMCRITNQHLSNFWPVILTELTRLFEFLQQEMPPEQEVLNVFLAACKFLDLLFVLQTDEFQVYEWMFITDTIDVIYRSTPGSSYAQLDKLSEKLIAQQSGDFKNTQANQIPKKSKRTGSPSPQPQPSSISSSISHLTTDELKRPMLTMRIITDLGQLEFFVRHVSLYVYQSTFSLAEPDLVYIESLLENDLLDGSGNFVEGNYNNNNSSGSLLS